MPDIPDKIVLIDSLQIIPEQHAHLLHPYLISLWKSLRVSNTLSDVEGVPRYRFLEVLRRKVTLR